MEHPPPIEPFNILMTLRLKRATFGTFLEFSGSNRKVNICTACFSDDILHKKSRYEQKISRVPQLILRRHKEKPIRHPLKCIHFHCFQNPLLTSLVLHATMACWHKCGKPWNLLRHIHKFTDESTFKFNRFSWRPLNASLSPRIHTFTKTKWAQHTAHESRATLLLLSCIFLTGFFYLRNT